MHSILIVIGIVVLGVFLCFVYLPRIMTPKRLDSLFHFILTLLATMTGVFLAFQISNVRWIFYMRELLLTESSCVRGDKPADEVSEHYRNLKLELSLQ